MGYGDDDPVQLTQRATRLRDYARQARTLAKSLGPYLDGAVATAVRRPGNPLAGGGMWTGPYADRCTSELNKRKVTLNGMAASLMADAARWESAASDLEDQAKAAKARKSGTPASGH